MTVFQLCNDLIDQFLDCRPLAHEDLAVCDAFAVLPETVTRERDIVDELLESC